MNAVEFLNDLDELMRVSSIPQLFGDLAGCDESSESINFDADQSKLRKVVKSLDSVQYKAGIQAGAIWPARAFIRKYFFTPDISKAVGELVFYEKRHTLRKLCLLISLLERYNFDRIVKNKSTPTLDDYPTHMANFAAFMQALESNLVDIRERHRGGHLNICEMAGPYAQVYTRVSTEPDEPTEHALL
tara:strand:- start:16 stop:579 length:564 start_codon:yes stop_codon:yes gene_type:complete